MAVPKNRTSKQRKHTRRAHWKLTAPAVGVCPQCHQPKLAHRVCPNCGYYNGRLAVAPKEATK
ncbi:MAG: 50S ribosomal protein L32 [Christensenella hongkongensis]|uniref:50S ribosomal protein L32 n=1 Tax=Christensenella hongkongensis TaxID=270498 RepID=UPI00073FD73D|nr:50S ribosomal protein L32 [Christensenella hongkongensis]KUJ25419.1 50S ribosomal protein L32 [Christensenella hongkongensis]MDY3005084.1 50S ribosomal protein L32 [Christensenella hongkongensis]TCW29397.1 LSU ribosomal protein L32P [Christensenella hongkongensis]